MAFVSGKLVDEIRQTANQAGFTRQTIVYWRDNTFVDQSTEDEIGYDLTPAAMEANCAGANEMMRVLYPLLVLGHFELLPFDGSLDIGTRCRRALQLYSFLSLASEMLAA